MSHLKRCVVFLMLFVAIPLASAEIIHPVFNDNLISQSNSFIGLSPVNIPDINVLACRIDIDLVEEIIECESGGNQDAIGRAGEIGIAQFMPTTWTMFNEMRGTKLNINSAKHQEDMLIWALSEGLGRHWTCWRKITGEN